MAKCTGVDNETTLLLMNTASKLFVSGDFEKAVGLYDEVLAINPAKVEADFQKGVSNMEIKQYEEATTSFDRVIEQNDNLFIQKSEWYRAGCLLAMDESDRARRQLAMIASSSQHYYKDNAAKILKRMKR